MAKRRGNHEGSISKRKDGTWQGYVTVGYDPKAEKSKRKYFYGKTKKEIQDKINDVAGKVRNGSYREPSKLSVAEWFKVWIEEYQKPSLRQTTWESYNMQIEKHILPSIGHIRLSELQTYHLQALYNDKQKDGARLDGKPGPLSPRSVRYIHTICHACLEQAKKEGRIFVNPAEAVRLPKDPKKDIQYLDTEQVKIFLSEARKSKYFAAFFLVLNTGLRRGELLALRWKDVDLKNGTIKVNQGLVRTKSGLTFQEPKTKLSKRTIGISREVINELKFHWRRQEGEKERAEEDYKNNGLVFCNELGEPLCPSGFRRHYDRILKRARLGKIPFHALRHTFATLALQQGTDYRTIQEAMGHHNVAFTLDVYSGVTDKMKQEATDKIGSLMASCLGKN